MNERQLKEFKARHTTAAMRQHIAKLYGRCVLCNGRRYLSCHHWWYPFKSCAKTPCGTATVNLVLVCRSCHRLLHAMSWHAARAKLLPIVAARLKTSPQDIRTILEGHCARRHVLDKYLLL